MKPFLSFLYCEFPYEKKNQASSLFYEKYFSLVLNIFFSRSHISYCWLPSEWFIHNMIHQDQNQFLEMALHVSTNSVHRINNSAEHVLFSLI